MGVDLCFHETDSVSLRRLFELYDVSWVTIPLLVGYEVL